MRYNLQKFNSTNNNYSKKKPANQTTQNIDIVLVVILLASFVLLAVSPYNGFSVLYIAGYTLYFFVSRKSKNGELDASFEVALHFTENNIMFYGAVHEEDFEYKHITDLTLHFHGVKNDDNEGLSFFSWTKNGKKYKYHISIDSEYPKSQLIKILKFMSKKQIQIKELNSEGKEMKFLSVLENKMTAKMEKKYFNMIENIGKEDKNE